MGRKGKPNLCAMTDPECPECGSSLWTERSNMPDDQWWCIACEIFFLPDDADLPRKRPGA